MSYLGWFISIILAVIVVIIQAIDKKQLKKEHKEEIERADKTEVQLSTRQISVSFSYFLL